MNLTNDLRAEFVRAKAYRYSWAMWPILVAAGIGFSLFAASVIAEALANGEPPAAQLANASFMPGMASAVPGLLVAILATILTTSDESSGTARNLRLAVSDRRLITARAATVSLVCLAATLSLTLVAVAVLAALAPSVLQLALFSGLFWGNVAGSLLVHLTWGLLALAFASWWPRTAAAMGGVLVVMLGLPSLEMGLRAAGWVLPVFAWSPEALIRATTATGPEAMTAVPSSLACIGLALWCTALLAAAAKGHRRLRHT